MISFSTGDVYITPPSMATDITPRKVGEVQEVSLDVSQETKELFGSSKYALMTAVTKAKITGKCKNAKLQGGLIATLLGGSYTTGTRIGAKETMGSAGTTYTVTNTTGFEDGGVWDASNVQVTKVASGATAGQYSVTAGGVYTFGTSGTYTVGYSYSSAATGKTALVTNSTMGLAPVFALTLYNTNPTGQKMGLKLYAATFSKFGMAFQIEDFTMPDMEFSCSADASGNVLALYLPDGE